MFDKVKDFVKNSRTAQLGLALLVGAAVGAFFYPTKHIEEKLKQTHQEEITQLNEQHSKELQKDKELYDKLTGEYKSYQSETQTKMSSLTTQITNLKKSVKTTYYKIVHPDGTVEIRKSSDSESEESTKIITQIQQEFTQKVNSIEQKWEKVHKERVQELQKQWDAKESSYKSTIDTLEKSKVIDINPKKYGMEVGVTTNASYYIHPSADIFGPFFLGMHGQVGTSNELGVGLGLHF